MRSAPLTPIRILAVDDWPEILTAYRFALSSPGIEIVTATKGQEALKQVQLQPFHLIVLDIDMPEMDGFEVCRQLKGNDQTQHIPIIFVTGNAQTAYEAQATTLGAVDYFTKPFDLNTLKSAVQRWAVRRP